MEATNAKRYTIDAFNCSLQFTFILFAQQAIDKAANNDCVTALNKLDNNIFLQHIVAKIFILLINKYKNKQVYTYIL